MGKASREKEQQAQKNPPPGTRGPGLKEWFAQHWKVLLFLPFLGIVIYFKTFSDPFHYDDSFFIVYNPEIKNFSSVRWAGSRYASFLSFALNYRIGGLNVFGYHLVNLLIHITNGFLVYALICTLFNTPGMQSSSSHPRQSYWIALTTALLFVVHPTQTMAVTYITQRFASLAALFYLLTVVFYLKWRLTPPETMSRSLWYAGALLFTVLAMKSKEISFTLPFMLLLIEAIFFRSSSRKRWVALIPFLLLLPIIPLSQIPNISVEKENLFARETATLTRLDYLFTQFRVIPTYLRLLIFPVRQNIDYDYPVYHSLFEPAVFFSFLFLSTLLGSALFLIFRRSTRYSQLNLIGFGLLWFFLTLSIESSIIPIRDVINEYRLYLPSVGFFLAGSVAVSGFLDRWQRMKAIVICVVVAILSIATYQRNLVWKDDLTLWSDTAQKSPNKARAHYNLGLAYQRLGRFDEVIREYKTALTLDPKDAEIHNNLGAVYQELGRLDDAVQEYETALELKPDFAGAHYNLGLVYLEQERFSEALTEFLAVVKLKPGFFSAYNNLGVVYQQLGRLEEAVQAYRTALSLRPDSVRIHINLGKVYKDLGRIEDAVREYQIAIQIKPDFVVAHYSLGQAYQHMGRIKEAIHEFELALKINPDYDPAREALKSLRQ